MQTIIMTVGTSLLTNRDRDDVVPKRPWSGQPEIGDRAAALNWMQSANPEVVCAEINTLWHLDPAKTDEIILLHSDTPSGLECAEVVRDFVQTYELFGQRVQLHRLPGINYELDEAGSRLEQMAKLLRMLVEQAKVQHNVTLAATGGFKAQTMIMALVGNACRVPVCYIHEHYRSLIYLPVLGESGQVVDTIATAPLPRSSRERSQVVNVQESKPHHRPKTWKRVAKMLEQVPWVEYVRFDQAAFAAPRNGVKLANRGTKDGRYVAVYFPGGESC